MKQKTQKPQVAVIYGSFSDRDVMSAATDILDSFAVPYVQQVLSAHRTPHETREFAEQAEAKGIKVIIAGAGLAAHLAGVVASHTVLPVIGVPLAAGVFAGFDALLATVQMPGGVPVAAVAVGKAGATNAALFAIEILALTDGRLRKALAEYRTQLGETVRAANRHGT